VPLVGWISTENVVVDNACDSAILRAIADKLIPGIAPATRISILRQTTFQEQEQALPDLSSLAIDKSLEKSPQQSALQYVIESDAYRNNYLREVAGPIPRPPPSLIHTRPRILTAISLVQKLRGSNEP
jgi:hypothetical protein